MRYHAQVAAPDVGRLTLGLGGEAPAELLMALGDGAPLRRHRIIELSDKTGELVANAVVRAAPRVLRWLVDPTEVDDEVADFAELYVPEPQPFLPAAALATLDDPVDAVRPFLDAQRSV